MAENSKNSNSILNVNKIKQYYDKQNVSYTEKNINTIHDKLNNSNYSIYDTFKSYFNMTGGTTLSSEYFGKDSGSYNELHNVAPTKISSYDAISNSTKPAIMSNTFPLMEGGCGCSMLGGNPLRGEVITQNMCSKCKGCNKDCCKNKVKQKGGCPMCKNMFTKKDVENVSKMLKMKIDKKDYDIVAASLTVKFRNDLEKNIKNNKNGDKKVVQKKI